MYDEEFSKLNTSSPTEAISALTIETGIEEFKRKFNFNGVSNTEKSFNRAISVFCEYIRSETSRNNVSMTTSLLDIPETLYADFVTWLGKATYDTEYRQHLKGKPSPSPAIVTSFAAYSRSTINLYSQAVKRMFYFWIDRKLSKDVDLGSISRSSGTKSSKSDNVSNTRALDVSRDFGARMIASAADSTRSLAGTGANTRINRLNALRAECLIRVLCDTGLRASDVALLNREQIENIKLALSKARDEDESARAKIIEVQMVKTGKKAICYLSEDTLKSIDTYLDCRKDSSPWLFIQHGKNGTIKGSTGGYSRFVKRKDRKTGQMKDFARKGYGAPLCLNTIWRIVKNVSLNADCGDDEYKSTHALRHWFAQRMRDLNVPIPDVQAALGHARVETTIKIYAPLPVVRNIASGVDKIHEEINGAGEEL